MLGSISYHLQMRYLYNLNYIDFERKPILPENQAPNGRLGKEFTLREPRKNFRSVSASMPQHLVGKAPGKPWDSTGQGKPTGHGVFSPPSFRPKPGGKPGGNPGGKPGGKPGLRWRQCMKHHCGSTWKYYEILRHRRKSGRESRILRHAILQ